jgi:hypothetical protein
MRYFKVLARFSAPTAPTAPTFVGTLVGTLFPQGRNTGRNTLTLYAVLFSRLKDLFFSGVGRNSRNTFPNSFQNLTPFEGERGNSSLENDLIPYSREEHDANNYQMDEFDHEDYDEWWDENCEEWWDGMVYNQRGKCWEKEAVDEAIEEENDQLGDIPF